MPEALPLADAVAAALDDPTSTPRTFLITGPHGVSLRPWLLALGRRFPERDAPAPVLDLGVLAGAPEAYLVSIGAGNHRPLVLVDGTRGDPDLVRWLRRAWLPRVPAGAVAVIALREVEPVWVADSGWRALTRVVTVGGPPALAAAPTPNHRAALIVAALAPRLTEDLLSAVVDRVAGPRLFEWLSALPGMEDAEVGLVPTRETRRHLRAETAGAPELPRLRLRLLAFHRRQIRRSPPRRRGLWAEGLLNLRLADHPVFADPGHLASEHLEVHPVRPAEARSLFAMLEETGGGAERVGVVDWWMARWPEAVQLCRAPDGGPILGLMLLSELDPSLAEEETRGPDPALSAAHWALRHRLRLGPRERALFLRGFLGAEPCPAPTAAERVLLAQVVARWVADTRLQVLLASVRPGDAWTLTVALGVGAEPLAHYQTDGQPRTLVALHRDPRVPLGGAEPQVHVPRDRFRQAVDVTLRQPAPDALAHSPLLACRRFMPPVAEADEVRVLVDRLLVGMADAEATGGDPEAMAVLRRLWRDPGLPQQVLADTLGISARTFRRRLAVATRLVTEALWRRFVEPGDPRIEV